MFTISVKKKTCFEFEYVYLALWIWTEEDSDKADQAIAVYKAVTLKLQGWWIPTQEHKILRKGTFGLDLQKHSQRIINTARIWTTSLNSNSGYGHMSGY